MVSNKPKKRRGNMTIMKKLQVLLIIWITLFNSILGQDWKIIAQDRYYNYSLDSIISTTIWIDSIYHINQDTVFVLNRVSSVCHQCEEKYSSSSVFLKNQPTIFQNKIVKKENGDYNFSDTANYLIRSAIQLGSVWLFDSLNLKYAIYQEKRYKLLFDNILDSVKIFKIDNDDTIIISKNFGIIKFPDFKGNHYKLIGIEGNSIQGTRNLYFKDFIDPDVGDVFQYSLDAGARFPEYEEIQKHTVLSIQKYEDSVIINTSMLSEKRTFDYNYPKETIFSSSEGKLVYQKSTLKFLDYYNFQNVLDTKPVRVDYDSTFKCLSKSFDQNGITVIGDTLYSTYNPAYQDNITQYSFGSKIGLLYFAHFSNHNGPFSNYNHKILKGYSHNGISYGSIYDDYHFHRSEDPKKVEVFVFPTVFNDVINIGFTRKISQASIIIIDMGGRIRYSTEEFYFNNILIRPEGLEKGIYILKIKGSGFDQINRKIVKI